MSVFFRLFLVSFTAFLINCGGGSSGSSSSSSSNDFVLTKISESTVQPSIVNVTFKVRTRTGDPVSDLSIDSFQIFENGDPISNFEATPSIAKDPDDFAYNTLLLLDLSGSVLATSFDSLKEGAETFINNAIPDAVGNQGVFRIKLAFFDGREQIQALSEYTSNKETLFGVLDTLNSTISNDNSTNLYGAMIQGVNDVEGIIRDVEQEGLVSAGALVVFTDGNDQAARATQEQAQESVDNASSALSIFTIGLEGELDENILSGFGREGTSFATDITELVSAFNGIAQNINDEVDSIYAFRYCSPKRSGEQNTLTIVAQREDMEGNMRGELTTNFSAESFSGGCQI